MKEVESWAKIAWRLKGGVLIAFLHEDLLYFEFSLPEEVSRALEMESRSLRGGFLDLERWNPDSGCIKSKDRAKEAWIRVVRLPLHLWTGEILIWEGCGGFITIDNETVLKTKVMWARLLVNLKGENRLSSINILVGMRNYELQIWWELKPWVAEVYSVRGVSSFGVPKPKEEDELPSRSSQCAWSKEEGRGQHGNGVGCQRGDGRGLIKKTFLNFRDVILGLKSME